MNHFQMFFVPLCAGMALLLMARMVRGHLSRPQGLFWALVWLAGAALIAMPNTSMVLAGWLGIGRGSDLVFYLAIIGGLAALLYFHNRYRTLEIIVTELVRREALAHPEHGPKRLASNQDVFEPQSSC